MGSTADDAATVETSRTIDWTYTSENNPATCRLANTPILVTVTFYRVGTSFPDVFAIERWLKDYLKQPTTAEELTVAACDAWQMRVKTLTTCDSHGPIECEVEP